jgi:hypothetical protein
MLSPFRTPNRILCRIGAFGLAVSALIAPIAQVAPAGAEPAATPRRVLLLALPTVTWADIRDHRLPSLDGLLAGSGIANLMLRTTQRTTDAGDGYATIGAGTRTSGGGTDDGTVLQTGESFGDEDGAVLYERRTGTPLDARMGAIGFPALVTANEALLFDSVPGLLGSTLRDAGWGRAVVANADRGEGETGVEYHREAALVLADRAGRVPAGTVSAEILASTPEAPYGRTLERATTLRAFDRVWVDGRVVLVEGSDLARADAYRKVVTADQRERQRRGALRRTDRLLGRVLERTDPERDLVVVFGAFQPSYAKNLGVFAIHGPGTERGLVESSTTRRAGYVALQDIAPTVLDRLGIDAPTEMEGRPVGRTGSDGPFERQVDRLARENRASMFRDDTIGTAMVVLAATVVIVTLAGLAVLLVPALARFRRVHAWLCLSVLGLIAATFLTEPFPFPSWGAGPYWVAVIGFAFTFGALTLACRRIDWMLPVMVATGALIALHGLDVLAGAHLQFATVFGYSPTVGVRVAGIGNPASAQLSAAALILSTLLVARLGARRGVPISAALLGTVLVVVAAPPWGQDFGGAISNAPAFGVFLWLAAGRRITRRTVAWFAIALVGAGLLVGLLDLLRPRASRTHVGRFFEKIGDEGFVGFWTVIVRKAGLMIQTFAVPTWVIATVALLAILAYLGWGTPWLRRLAEVVPSLRAGGIAFAVMAVLGMLLNDSGITVPGMMLAVMVPCLLALTTLQPAADPGAAGVADAGAAEPDPEPAATAPGTA